MRDNEKEDCTAGINAQGLERNRDKVWTDCKGIWNFQQSYFRKEEDFFRRLSGGQFPEVLFVTCSDSRVDPNLVTQSRPGELFIVRNVGKIIPPYDAIKDKNSVAAAIEYAVLKLRVSDIIICGHSNCGAMQVLYAEENEIVTMPHLRDWLHLAAPVRDIIMKHYSEATDEIRQRVTEEENVILQLYNIQTYPFVKKALNNGSLHLHGWYYNIGTGQAGFHPIRKVRTCASGFRYAALLDISVIYKLVLSLIVLSVTLCFRNLMDFLMVFVVTGIMVIAEMFNTTIEALASFILEKGGRRDGIPYTKGFRCITVTSALQIIGTWLKQFNGQGIIF